jgi:hypothetical protein
MRKALFLIFLCQLNIVYAADFIFGSTEESESFDDGEREQYDKIRRGAQNDINSYQKDLKQLALTEESLSELERNHQYLGEFWYWHGSFIKHVLFIRNIKTNEIKAAEEHLPLEFNIASILQNRVHLKKMSPKITDRDRLTNNPLSLIPDELCGKQNYENYAAVKEKILSILNAYFQKKG